MSTTTASPLPRQRPQTRPLRRRHRPPPDFDAPLQNRVNEWSAALQPQSQPEHFLVRRIALATLRMDQCTAINAHLQYNHTQKSPELHALDRQIEAQKLIKRFDADPTLTRLQLMRTYDGTLHLARRWRALTQPKTLPATPQAVEETLTLVANLLGIHPDHRPGSPQLLKLKKLFEIALRPDATPEDRESAHRRLRALARHHAKQLRHHAETNLKPLADLESARIAAGASLPMTTEARLARRYEAAANREFNRALTLLNQLRKNRHAPASQTSHALPPRRPSPIPPSLSLDLLADLNDNLPLDDDLDVDDETLAQLRANYQATLRAYNIPPR